MNNSFSRLSVNTLTTSELLTINGGTPFLMDDFSFMESEGSYGKKSSPNFFDPSPVEEYPVILPIRKGTMDPNIW